MLLINTRQGYKSQHRRKVKAGVLKKQSGTTMRYRTFLEDEMENMGRLGQHI
jgi:hypothetical protein